MVEIEELLGFIKGDFINFVENKIIPKVRPIQGGALGHYR